MPFLVVLPSIVCAGVELARGRKHTSLSFYRKHEYSDRCKYITRNSIVKRLEPYFQNSATRSGVKDVTGTVVDLAHLREHTKERISALPNYGPMGKF